MFVCVLCREHRSDNDDCDVRIEFRALADYSRQNVVGLGHLCRGCATRVAAAITPPTARAALWDALMAEVEHRPIRDVQTSLPGYSPTLKRIRRPDDRRPTSFPRVGLFLDSLISDGPQGLVRHMRRHIRCFCRTGTGRIQGTQQRACVAPSSALHHEATDRSPPSVRQHQRTSRLFTGPHLDAMKTWEPMSNIERKQYLRRIAELEAALEAIAAWTRLKEGRTHRGYAVACGEDVCAVCLIESTAKDALSPDAQRAPADAEKKG